jgi:predicted Rossmann fold nucleotide-binding protein DprA/Smf involved in DNA uptake
MPYAVNVIEPGSPDYPQTLKTTDNSACYPQIWAIGNLEILNKKLLGFFCSIKCPGGIILKTYDLARSFRDAGIPLISGFHSPIEKDVFDLLLSGSQPLVVCPARSIENMRIPKTGKEAIEKGRLLVLSPFEKKHKRVTASLSEQRNRMVAMLANEAFFPYAAPGSRSENLCKDIIRAGKQTLTFEDKANQSIIALGAKPIKDEYLKEKSHKEQKQKES